MVLDLEADKLLLFVYQIAVFYVEYYFILCLYTTLQDFYTTLQY